MISLIISVFNAVFVTIPSTALHIVLFKPVKALVHYATLPMQHLALQLYRGVSFIYKILTAFEDLYIFFSLAVIAGLCAGLALYAVSRQTSALVHLSRSDLPTLSPAEARDGSPRSQTLPSQESWAKQARDFADGLAEVVEGKPIKIAAPQSHLLPADGDGISDF